MPKTKHAIATTAVRLECDMNSSTRSVGPESRWSIPPIINDIGLAARPEALINEMSGPECPVLQLDLGRRSHE
jgi:hypothetical protein